MRSYQLQQYEAPLACQDGATPTPQGDEILVRIKACGVCHSDVHIWQGFFDFGEGKRIEAANLHSLPHTLGHEIVGTVESCGMPNSGVEPGDSVVTESRISSSLNPGFSAIDFRKLTTAP